VLHQAKEVDLVALFGPEHGIYGDEYAGDKVPDRKDPRTGLPVFSLYGETRKPTAKMLEQIDTLVLDLQDLGARSYTYISTMKVCMEACSELDKELVILDRPNPLGGERIEGPDLKPGFESFIGLIPVPYVHGMTMGELAQFVNAKFYPEYSKLRVVKMSGWSRNMVWQDTGRDWVPTSPHIPQAIGCASYVATGIMGELYGVSIGVGYTLPFQIVGAPWIDGDALADALNDHWRDPHAAYEAALRKRMIGLEKTAKPQGVYFRSARFKPFFATFAGEACRGVQVHIDPRSAETLVEINFRLMQALNARELLAKSQKRWGMFDKANGSDEVRKALLREEDLEPLFESWRQQCAEFREERKPHLLY